MREKAQQTAKQRYDAISPLEKAQKDHHHDEQLHARAAAARQGSDEAAAASRLER